MPRLHPSLFQRAGRISPHLATLLPACRTVESAQTELRWIRRHVLETPPEPASHRRNNEIPRPSPGNGKHRARARTARVAGFAARPSSTTTNLSSGGRPDTEDRIARLVARRGAGEPLQYILGTQPFGDLEMLCEKGVLIPRPETEAWASMLADLALSSRDHIHIVDEGKDGEDVRVLDLCSGTGCIGLSLYARGMALRRQGASEGKGKGKGEGAVARSNPPLRVFGFDVEPRAVRLGRKNLRHNFSRRHLSRPGHSDIIIIIEEEAVKQAVTFEQADIFTDEWMASLEHNNNNDNPSSKYEDEDEDEHKAPSRRRRRRRIDVLVSNPPYVSQRGFETDTGRNVRNYEPKLALVPSPSPSPSPACAPEDIFYARLLEIADTLRPRIAAFEVGDMAQAIRVVEMAIARRCRHLHPDSSSSSQREDGEDGDAARWDVLEIWRDWPDCLPSDAEEDGILVCGRKVPVRGSGHGRVVFLSEGPILRNRFTNRGFRRAFYTE